MEDTKESGVCITLAAIGHVVIIVSCTTDIFQFCLEQN